MLPLDRETMLIAGVIVCIAVVAYMFNDMRKTKEDVHAVKTFSVNLMKNLTIEPIEDEAKPQTVTKIPVTEEKRDE
tara:strand:+ start:768 stop:995 length:228 start_codon:yes stop_codon:yes gene_type:complete